MSTLTDASGPERIDLSVVICTRDRAASLRQTLDDLSRDSREGIDVEVVVVDNGSHDGTREVALSFGGKMDVQYLREERCGKHFALNRALDEVRLGRIVAFLDDDMSVEKGWIKGVVKSCEKWPEHDIFSGRSYVIFPEHVAIPKWAYEKRFHGWAFSVADPGVADRPLRRGTFPSGNHFWVRSRAIGNEHRFPPLWLTEPGLVLGLQQAGFNGMWVGGVATGHRIQAPLLDPKIILGRMAQFGRDYPFVRLANPAIFWQARMFRALPVCWVALCLLNSVRWYVVRTGAFMIHDVDRRFMKQIRSTVRFHDNWSTVKNWKGIKRFISTRGRPASDRQTEANAR